MTTETLFEKLSIGEVLKKMVQKGWLVSESRGRGTRYRLNRKYLENEEGGQVGGQAALEGGQAGGQAGKTPDITLYDWHVLQALSLGDKSAKELKSFQTNSSNVSGAFKERIAQLMKNGLIEFTIPDKPKSPKQKYRLTELGKRVVEKQR